MLKRTSSLSVVHTADICQFGIYLFVCRHNIFLKLDLSILLFTASGFCVTSERSLLPLD